MNRSLRALGSLVIACALVFAHPAWALGPLEKNHPLIEAGTEAYDEGRYEDALAAFEAAKQQLPDNPAVDFNIGNALHKLGRHQEAKDAWTRATRSRDKELQQKAWYNLGNGYAAEQKRKEAISAYRRALTLDPKDELARHNLEVLLRDVPPKKGGQDGGTDGGQDGGSDGGQKPDAGAQHPDGGTDGGSDGGADGGGSDGGAQDGGAQDGGGADGGGGDGGSDGGAGDGGPGDAGSPDGGADGGQSSGGGDGGSDGGSDGGQDDQGGDGGTPDAGADGGASQDAEPQDEPDGGQPAELSEQDAEKLLDSMEQNEKNLQLWRFQQKKKQRGTHEKDW